MSARTFDFSVAVITEYRRLDAHDEAEQVLWRELLRTQTSLATNAAEADSAHSRKDFALKFQIALKEAREAMQLLRLLHATSPARTSQLAALIAECNDITAILVASLRTAKDREALARAVPGSRSPR